MYNFALNMVLRILIFLHLNLGHVHTNPDVYETA